MRIMKKLVINISIALTLAPPLAAIAQDTITVAEYGKEQKLGEAGVRGRRKGTTKLWTTAENKELISTAGLRVAACCNLGESFVNSASVDVNYSDAATGAKQIRLLGLSGTYVQMLTENIPNFRTVAAPYALGYIPGSWMQSIQVSKGITSVKQGYEAMTGQINVEYKKPQQPDPDFLAVNLYGNSKGRIEGNADATFKLPSGWGTTLLAHYDKDLRHHDMNHDGFADMPQVQQYNVMNRWYYETESYEFQVGAKFLDEKRCSGQLGKSSSSDILSPVPFLINIDSRRVEGFMKNAYKRGCDHGCNFALVLSGSYHDQNNAFGNKAELSLPNKRFTQYDVAHTNLYGCLMYEGGWNNDRHTLSTGAAMNYDGMKRTTLIPYTLSPNPNTAVKPTRRQHETVGGLYTQYALNLGNKFLIQTGARFDYSNLWGAFFTPRLHLKYTPNHHMNFRLSAGKGYRTAFVLDENSYLLSGGRKVVLHDGEALRESDWNAGIAAQFKVTVGSHNLDIAADYSYTDFQKQAVMDFDRDPHAVNIYQLQGRSFSQVAQVELSYPFFTSFTASAAFRWTDARCTYDGVLRERPLTSRYKAILTLQYRTRLDHWQFDATLTVNGKGRMPQPDVIDGEKQWSEYYKAFPQLSTQVTRNFRRWSIYLGGENLTNFTQKNPIVAADNPWSNRFDPTMVWGPVDGWMLYAGLRFNLPR